MYVVHVRVRRVRSLRPPRVGKVSIFSIRTRPDSSTFTSVRWSSSIFIHEVFQSHHDHHHHVSIRNGRRQSEWKLSVLNRKTRVESKIFTVGFWSVDFIFKFKFTYFILFGIFLKINPSISPIDMGIFCRCNILKNRKYEAN